MSPPSTADRPPVVVVTGPTASGKTPLAIELALRFAGEVVNADSMQVFRFMDIGTAKPSLDERCGIPHHGFDVVAPSERYSAGRFARDARRWIAGIRSRHAVPILTGGTGFFLRALTTPLFREPELPGERREALKRWLATQSAHTVHRAAALHERPAAGRVLPRYRAKTSHEGPIQERFRRSVGER